MRKTAEINKQDLIADLTDARQTLLSAAAATPPADQDTPFLGAWSVHDIVAHLIGWDFANLEALRALSLGQVPAFYAHHDKDWRTFNASLIVRYKEATLDETMLAAQASRRELLDALSEMPAGDFARDRGVRSPGGRKVTTAMLVTAEASDEHTHCKQIRAFITQLASGG